MTVCSLSMLNAPWWSPGVGAGIHAAATGKPMPMITGSRPKRTTPRGFADPNGSETAPQETAGSARIPVHIAFSPRTTESTSTSRRLTMPTV
jgi:hypothetical protein